MLRLPKHSLEKRYQQILAGADCVHDHLSTDALFVLLNALYYVVATCIHSIQKQIFKLRLMQTLGRLFIKQFYVCLFERVKQLILLLSTAD